ncbi:MAG TPA: ATP-binding protein [Rhodopila sp.]|uniref:cache domain-containing sensor histidine kinase n=1 Tax=Rhodopila sp. TaxID=2480087 RepID=UPI002BC70F7F|nr:ATP-binding protein [Rhodopila sp.]HVY14317.1 ATP-binding protein [Rhodopila sp.]
MNDTASEPSESSRLHSYKGNVRQQAVQITRQIIGTAIFLAACMWGIIAWSLCSEYDRAREQARTEESNLVAALAGELRQTFDSAHRAFVVLQQEINTVPAQSPMSDALRTFGEMEHKIFGADRTVAIADADGHIVYNSASDDLLGNNVGDTAHFLKHRTDQGLGLLVNALEAHAHILVSGALHGPDGQFVGEVMQVLPVTSLLSPHREFDLGARGVVAITNTKGVILAGFEHGDSDGTTGLGADLSGDKFPDNLQPDVTSFYTRDGKVDQVERMVAIRRIDQYDLDVLVALAVDDVLRSTYRHIWLICFLGVGASALIGGLTTLLVREVWHSTRKEIELAADRERLQQAQAQIEIERSRLADMNHELIASKERVEVANRTKSQFLAHMSHELRTPLHAIIGFSELVRDQAPNGPRDPPLGEYASDILTSGRHLLDLINTILDITKIESGTAVLTESTFPLADLVRNALVTIRAQADLRHISIDVRLPETPIRLHADRTRMLQVLINLLSNAVKFTQEDGQIVVSAIMNPGGDVVLSVIDSGIGMTETEIQIALEPFGQVDSALSRSYQGTGLGLPLAVRLMELHGGRLEITSIKGKGTAVRVTVPAKRVALRSGLAA